MVANVIVPPRLANAAPAAEAQRPLKSDREGGENEAACCLCAARRAVTARPTVPAEYHIAVPCDHFEYIWRLTLKRFARHLPDVTSRANIFFASPSPLSTKAPLYLIKISVDGGVAVVALGNQQLNGLFLKGVEGDSASYREFLVQLRVFLRAYVSRQIRRMGLPDADIDDIVQEALIAVNAKRHTYDGAASVADWAVAITRYKLIDCLRAASRSEDIQFFGAPDPVVRDEGCADARITVRRFLALLPDRFRIPIELMKIEGLSASEAARRIGTSEVSVRVSVHRGLAKLARLCGAAGESHDRD